MPSLYFVLPHWLYWGTLIVFPEIAWYLVARQRRLGEPRGPSLFIAYLLWLCAGFFGLHRFYLRSLWGLVFIPVFLAILYVNGDIRDAREDVSRTRAALETAQIETRRAQPLPGADQTPTAAERFTKAQAAENRARTDYNTMVAELATRRTTSRGLALLLAAMLLVDAVLLPRLVRRSRAEEARERATAPPEIAVPDVPPVGTAEDPTLGFHTRFTDAIEWVNVRVG